VTSKDVLAKLKDLGEFVKSASSTVEAPVARRLRDSFPKADGPSRPNRAGGNNRDAAPRPASPAPAAATAAPSTAAPTPVAPARPVTPVPAVAPELPQTPAAPAARPAQSPAPSSRPGPRPGAPGPARPARTPEPAPAAASRRAAGAGSSSRSGRLLSSSRPVRHSSLPRHSTAVRSCRPSGSLPSPAREPSVSATTRSVSAVAATAANSLPRRGRRVPVATVRPDPAVTGQDPVARVATVRRPTARTAVRARRPATCRRGPIPA